MKKMFLMFMVLIAGFYGCNRYVRDANWIQAEYKTWSESSMSHNNEYDDFNLTQLLKINAVCNEMQTFKAPEGYPSVKECESIKKQIDQIRARNIRLEKKKYYELFSLLLIPANVNFRYVNDSPYNPFAVYGAGSYHYEPFQRNIPRGLGVGAYGELAFLPVLFNLGDKYYNRGLITVMIFVTADNNLIYKYEDTIQFTASPHSRAIMTSRYRTWPYRNGIVDVAYFIRDVRIID